jgi:hypothetical protein
MRTVGNHVGNQQSKLHPPVLSGAVIFIHDWAAAAVAPAFSLDSKKAIYMWRPEEKSARHPSGWRRNSRNSIRYKSQTKTPLFGCRAVHFVSYILYRVASSSFWSSRLEKCFNRSAIWSRQMRHYKIQKNERHPSYILCMYIYNKLYSIIYNNRHIYKIFIYCRKNC